MQGDDNINNAAAAAVSMTDLNNTNTDVVVGVVDVVDGFQKEELVELPPPTVVVVLPETAMEKENQEKEDQEVDADTTELRAKQEFIITHASNDAEVDEIKEEQEKRVDGAVSLSMMNSAVVASADEVHGIQQLQLKMEDKAAAVVNNADAVELTLTLTLM